MNITNIRMEGYLTRTAVIVILFELVIGILPAVVRRSVSETNIYNASCPETCDCKMGSRYSIKCSSDGFPVNTTNQTQWSLPTLDELNLCSPLLGATHLSVSGLALSCLDLSCIEDIIYTHDPDITPCPDRRSYNLSALAIRNVSDLSETNLFPLPNLWSLNRLDLSQNTLRHLYGLCGQNLSYIGSLDLSNNHISAIPGGHLRCLPQLVTLDLSHNDIVNVTLSLPIYLHYLNMSHNAITTINPGAFSAFSSLLELDLSFNHIEAIDSATFACHLNQLKLLNLAGNRIQLLATAAFTGLDSLWHLNLSNNQLDEVTGEPFIHIPQKECSVNGVHLPNETYMLHNTSTWINFDVIDLSYNNITEVNRNLFKSAISNCRSIRLSHNNVRHFPRYGLEMLPKIEILFLDHNQLYWLDVGTFTSRTLKHINLSHNRLRKIISMTFLFLPDIELVDLSHNELNFIYKVAFYKSCKHNQRFKVDLSHNFLTEDVIWDIVTSFRHLTATECIVDLVVRSNILRGVLGLSRSTYERHLVLIDMEYFTVWDHVTLDIQDNPLNCDCSLMSDVSLLTETRKLFDGNITNTHHLDFWFNAKCVLPMDKINQTVDEVLETSLCSSLLKCPYECECYFENITVVNCTRRNLVTIPFDLPPGLKKLYFADNYIMELEDGSYLDNVTYLDLSSNALINVEPDVFYRFASPVTILLHNNVLNQLPNSILHLENASAVSLHGNPISCDCENWWFVDWIMNHSHIIMDYDNITCNNEKRIDELDKDVVMSACTKTSVFEGRSISVLYVALGVALTLGFLAIIIVTLLIQSRRRILPVLMNRLSWYRLNLEEQNSTKEEILMWYSPIDEDWVSSNLFDMIRHNMPLHTLCPYHQCLVHPEDQHESFTETQDCIQKSFHSAKCVVIVLSNNFMATEWSAFDEWHGQQRLEFLQDALQTPLFFVAIEVSNLSDQPELCELIRGHSYHEVTEPLWREALVDGISYTLSSDLADAELAQEERLDPGLPQGDTDWTDDESLGLREKY